MMMQGLCRLHRKPERKRKRNCRLESDNSLLAGDPENKKIGAESGDPNRHSQPRLPGSVVGDASMRPAGFGYKITEVTVLK